MFCPRCGKEIPDEANFCSFCSAPVRPKASSNAENGMEAKGNLKETLRSSRRIPSKMLTRVIIVALALALGASVAYAAYYAYTNVYLPSQQAQQQPASQNQEPTYTVNTVTESVSVPSDPMTNPGQRTDDTWTYPQIVSSVPSNAIDNINRRIQETMENSASKTSAYPDTWSEVQNKIDNGSDEYAVCTLSRGMEITYLDDTYVCIHDAGYATGWGAHGFHFSQSQTYNLKTGELVDPWTVFGMSEDEAVSATEQAVKTYLASNPSDIYKTSEVVSAIEDRISNYNEGYSADQSASSQTFSPFVITNEGLVYMTGDYELGSYAFGTRNILVKGFSNNAKAGTAVELGN